MMHPEQFVSLDGFELVRDEHMVGMKKAVLIGRKLCVSPAMYKLLSKETGESLRKLMASIQVVEIPEYRPDLD